MFWEGRGGCRCCWSLLVWGALTTLANRYASADGGQVFEMGPVNKCSDIQPINRKFEV